MSEEEKEKTEEVKDEKEESEKAADSFFKEEELEEPESEKEVKDEKEEETEEAEEKEEEEEEVVEEEKEEEVEEIKETPPKKVEPTPKAQTEVEKFQEKYPDLEDDGYLTVGQTKEYNKAIADDVKQENLVNAMKEFDAQRNLDEVEAKKELTTEKMGKGLDYETVMKTGGANLSMRDFDVIGKAVTDPTKNAAKIAYEIVLKRTPELASKVKVDNAEKDEKEKKGTKKEKKEPETPSQREILSASDETVEALFGEDSDDEEEET